MSLNKHTRLIGQHAFLSPSSYHWLDDDEDKLRRRYLSKQQARIGDQRHELAMDLITQRVKLPDNGTTLSMYVNDAIGYRLTPEQHLYYSDECFGKADAVGFRNNTLRIFDLKTGLTPADMRQLLIYAGIFCFEYGQNPDQIDIVLRIYQNDAIQEMIADSAEVFMVMDRIKTQSAVIEWMRKVEED
jgi:hypothetical protein